MLKYGSGAGANSFLAPRTPAQEQQAHKELLQRQLSSLTAVSRRVANTASAGPRGAAQQRRAALASLRAAALRGAQSAAAEAGRDLDCELQQLADELAAWAARAEASGGGGGGPGDWLLCTADASGYAARDAEMQQLISRGLSLVSAAAGVAPPPGADGGDDAGGGGAAGDAQRWQDQERRNEGLKEELKRQRAAFKVGVGKGLRS